MRGCEIVRDRLGIAVAMCHLVRSAACAWRAGVHKLCVQTAGSACSDGFYDPKPKITTGAGDHFNAGFIGALLAGLQPLHALQTGGATSGHYVRTAESPERAQLIAFLQRNA
jgi:sugar/nucleoside kinase (ribokinase family)